MIRPKFTSFLTLVTVVALPSSAQAIEFEVIPPEGLLDWAAIAFAVFFCGWGALEFAGWLTRRSKIRRLNRMKHDEHPEP